MATRTVGPAVVFAKQSLCRTNCVRAEELSSWIKDFHYLFEMGYFSELVSQAPNVLPHLSLMRPTEIVMVANHFSRCHFDDNHWWGQFCSCITPRLQDLDGSDLSLLMNALAQVGFQDQTIFDVLAKEAAHWSAHSNGRDCSLILGALSRLQFIPYDIFRIVSERAKVLMLELNFIDLSAIVASCARASFLDIDLLESMSSRIVEESHRMDERNISMITWGYSELRVKNTAMMDALSSRLRRICDSKSIKFSYLSTICGSFAKLQCGSPDLSEVIRKQAPLSLGYGDTSAQVALLSALSKLQITSPHSLTSQLLERLEPKIREGTIQAHHVVNIATATSRLQVFPLDKFWQTTADFISMRLHSLSAEDSSSVCLAFAKVKGTPDWRPRFFDNIMQRIHHLSAKGSPRALSTFASSLATMGLKNLRSLSIISTAATAKVHEFSPVDVHWLICAFGDLDVPDMLLFKVFGRHINRHRQKYLENELEAIANAYLKVGIHDDNLADLLELQGTKNRARSMKDAATTEEILPASGYCSSTQLFVSDFSASSQP
eukprot:GHVQ01015824.1.p1 GENE.GHVQ01015824.1~~GHVQ01015824.1.p1  ORF type:complete len:548 (+),score=26.51 GHVQ01015824.1:261-1904(+)